MNNKKTELELVNDITRNDSQTMLATIHAAALDPNVDTNKMKVLLDMQERILDKNAEIAFNKSMIKCQGEIHPVPKDGRNPITDSSYSKLETMQFKAMPVISKNGFSLSYGTDNPPSEMEIRIICKVSHTEGHSRDYFVDIPRDDTGMKGAPTKTKTHGTGSSLSYGQRYLMKMIFNIQVGGLDNDGNGDTEAITEDQTININAMIEETGADKERYLKWLGFVDVQHITVNYYNKAIKGLEAKRSLLLKH